MYLALPEEEACDVNQFGTKFANIIGTQPNITIEEVAKQLRRGGTHVEWRSNLDRWSGQPIGQVQRRHLASRTMLAMFAAAIFGLCNIWFGLAEQLGWHSDPVPEFVPLESSSSFCDGPYLRLNIQDISRGKEILNASQDDASIVCLAHLYWMQDDYENAQRLFHRFCSSSESQLPKTVACFIECDIRDDLSPECLRYALMAEEIACAGIKKTSVCIRATLRAALFKNMQTWTEIAHGQQSWDPHVLKTLASFNRSTVPEEVRFAALLELADSELAAGDLKVATSMLFDLLPFAARVAHRPLLKQMSHVVFVDYMDALLRSGLRSEARPWFDEAVKSSRNDVYLSKVYFILAEALIKFNAIDEATQWILMGTELIRNTKLLGWNASACHDPLAVSQEFEPIINSSCLEAELMKYPFYFDRKSASLLARAQAPRKIIPQIFR